MKEICTLKIMKYFSRMSRNKVTETLPLVKQRKTRYKTNNKFYKKKVLGKKNSIEHRRLRIVYLTRGGSQ
jgi:hypothetical protein